MYIDPKEELLKPAIALGFPNKDDVIHIFAGGSHQHGARLDDNGDMDICGVYIPPQEQVLMKYMEGGELPQSFVASTSEKKRRNNAGDADVTLYSLRRWAELAVKGNPTVLSYLFMPSSRTAWRMVEDKKYLFLAKSHAEAFKGYGRAQLKRLTGERGSGKHGQRSPLIDLHGYDTKAAMHMIRMMFECYELLTKETITYPRPDVAQLLAIRRGEWKLDDVRKLHRRLEERIDKVLPKIKMQAEVDRPQIRRLIKDAHRYHWGLPIK